MARSELRQAFEFHQANEFPEVAIFVDEFVREQRWKNFQKRAGQYPAIAEIVTVEISRTSDTGQAVISLTAVNGDRVSFWCTGGNGGPVRSITDY